MSSAARSVAVFGYYILLTGVGLGLAPNMVLGVMGIAPATEVWIRVVGLVAGVLGVYYLATARSELAPFFRISVAGRLVGFLGLAALALTGTGPMQLIAFGLVDGLGALWTFLALRSDAKVSA